ncbi:MAG: response regulator transcription factor, partial [Deltaproteobacteria bacterium]|nr:response regulator transcription factor [Deltaproteobacteria bacterium]
MAKILIVEDEAEDFERIAVFLKNKGFQIVGAKNGYEGIYQFDKESPDLVVLDWNMPGLAGIEVCRTIKEKKKQVPIVILTIQPQLQHKREGFQAGCDDYLVKPCDMNELLARIQYLLGKIQKPVLQKLTYGDIL